MRAVVWFILLFVVAVVAATTFGRNDGLVSLYWSGWRVDLSLNLFIVLLLASCFVLLSAAQALRSLISLPERAREWRTTRRVQAAQAALREAQAEYFGARYGRAHKAAQRALEIQASIPALAPDHELLVLSHLLAAASLHRMQDRGRRDEHMLQVQQLRHGLVARAAQDGAQLLEAEWAIDDRDAPRALRLLGEMPPGVARRTQALRLKLQAQRLARLPLDALRSARLLAKHQGFSPTAAQGLLRSLAGEAIDAAHDIDQLRRTWLQLDSGDRRDPFVAARAATRAARFGAAEEARSWLRPLWEELPALGADGRAEVAHALQGGLDGIGADWLPRLEQALVDYPQEPQIALAVGLALGERRLWGKARRPLEQAARNPALDPLGRRRAWLALSTLAREQDDEQRAQDCERAASRLH